MTSEQESTIKTVDHLMHITAVLNNTLDDIGDDPVSERILNDAIFRTRCKIIEMTNKLSTKK